MNFKEQLDVINSVPKTELASALNISRQGLYNRLKNNNDIDEIYKMALKLQENTSVLKYEEKINQLNSKIEILNEEIKKYKSIIRDSTYYEKYIELKKDYKHLEKKYSNQNNELCSLKVLLSKERGEINDIKRS